MFPSLKEGWKVDYKREGITIAKLTMTYKRDIFLLGVVQLRFNIIYKKTRRMVIDEYKKRSLPGLNVEF